MPEIITLKDEVLILAHSFVGFSPCWLGLLLLDLSGKNIMAEESASFMHQEADKEEEEG